jgi:hypothetical protein
LASTSPRVMAERGRMQEGAAIHKKDPDAEEYLSRCGRRQYGGGRLDPQQRAHRPGLGNEHAGMSKNFSILLVKN